MAVSQDTSHASLSLYQYLCRNLVGTDNYVKRIRLMNTVRDTVKSNEYITAITSGSFGEGLEMRGSDLDVMHVEHSIKVYADTRPLFAPNMTYCRMETDNVKPGFTQLLVEQSDSDFVVKWCEELEGKLFFSSALCKQHLSNDANGEIHGPCTTDEEGNVDFAFSLHCKTWISSAGRWISRSRNSWPSAYVKQNIIKHGVLFVPIGVKGSPKENVEWRISFSVGEKLLINSFTHTQLLCYALLKIIIKDVIAINIECEDLLCSYFLKTIILWISEELPLSVWKPDNLIHCFMRCFCRLVYCVEYSVCWHYFIPENNMFENKIEGRAREILRNKLSALHSYGWQCILFSDQLSKFYISMCNFPIAPNAFHDFNIIEILLNSELMNVLNNIPYGCRADKYTYHKGIQEIMSCNKSSIKYLYVYFRSMKCTSYAQSISLNSKQSSNKDRLKQYRSCLCSLLQSINHNAASGWLMVTSFFYKTKQYKKALHIINYSIAKYTPEKLYYFMKMSDIHQQYLELKSFKKKSFVQLMKILLIDDIIFKSNSELIPDELQVELEIEKVYHHFPSLAYAYFFNFLCHYHLNNVRQCQDCLQTLQSAIADNHFIKGSMTIFKAYNVLGITLQMLGDLDSSRQAFIQSVEMCPDRKRNASVRRLSLISSL